MPTQTDALATIYARSLYELAEAAGGTEKIFEVGDELEQICELARGDRKFAEFVISPIIEKTARADALGRMFRDRITDLTLRFLLVLNAKDRLGHLEPIQSAFDRLVQEAHGRVEVDVFTAAPLGSTQLQHIKDRINSSLGKEAVLHPYTDGKMIGGLKLRVGDQLIDGSVATRLQRIRASILSSGGAVRSRVNDIVDGGSA